MPKIKAVDVCVFDIEKYSLISRFAYRMPRQRWNSEALGEITSLLLEYIK